MSLLTGEIILLYFYYKRSFQNTKKMNKCFFEYKNIFQEVDKHCDPKLIGKAASSLKKYIIFSHSYGIL